jgi:aspartyl protease family protein
MLKNAVLFAAVACLLAVFGPSLLSQLAPAPSAPARALAVAAPPPVASAPAAQTAPPNFREVSIPSDGRGQFAADVMLNGTPTHMLVDTGATVVSISAATAARIGATPAPGPKWIVQTANGKSSATPTMLRDVSFGGIYMNDVEALILAPEAGEVNLLGASFLKRLASVEQRNGLLVMRQ